MKHSITLSIVSHGQASLIRPLLISLEALIADNIETIITINIPEDESFLQGLTLPLRIIRNSKPKGFGENNNTAFRLSKSEFFAVINPDIRFDTIDFPTLIEPFLNSKIGAVAPSVLAPNGKIEDNARKFPTLTRLGKRIFLNKKEPDYKYQTTPITVDWVAGMFIVFRSKAYKEVSGFDDRRFYMYMEDADICKRLNKNGWEIVLNPNISVIHLAQRASHRNIKHLNWHITSVLRYLTGF